MKHTVNICGLVTGSALAALATGTVAQAGALEQVVPSTTRLLYEEGHYIELGFGRAVPKQSGDGAYPGGSYVPGNTGQIFDPNTSFSGAYKADLNDRFSYVIGIDQPFAGKTTYGAGSLAAPVYEGTYADMETWQATAVLSYDLTPNVKLYGGVRAQRFTAESSVSSFGYSLDTQADWGYGYLAGAAYERPEIALRVALTYYSDISYNLASSETVGGITSQTTTDLATPQSLQLDLQTGIAPKTLVFGFVRWVDWSSFDVTPPVFGQTTAAVLGQSTPLVSYEGDIWTYNLGIGHQFTDRLAGAFSITYEPQTGDTMPSLAPYDGQVTGTLALSYDFDKFNVTGGISYGRLGDAKNDLGTDYNDGSVWGAGMRISYNF